MKIKELRDYLNGLSEDVLDYEVGMCDGFDVGSDKNRNIELNVMEIKYEEIVGGRYVTTTRLQNEKDIKRCGYLYLECDNFNLGKDESLVIVQNDYKIMNTDNEIIW